jgi:mRNA-degrading endonuclease RelE of RelBE toxin-antitoxin system
MRYEILLAPEAVEDLEALRANARTNSKTRFSDTCGMNQRSRARAGSSGCAASRVRSFDYVLAMFACSTT